MIASCCPVHGPGALSAAASWEMGNRLRLALAKGEDPHVALDPGVVPQEALDYFEAKGIEPGFDYQDVWAEEHAYAFTAAGEMRLDVLSDIRDGVANALREGHSFETFRKLLGPDLEAAGWEGDQRNRLKTIFLTNMRVARAAGHWARVQRTKRDRPYLLYRLGPSNRHRPHHVVLDGTLLPADDPFWSTHYPPNGYGCKCYVRQLSEAGAARLGGVTAVPDIEPIEHTIKGQIVMVPRGVDPGWDYNPGAVRQGKAA